MSPALGATFAVLRPDTVWHAVLADPHSRSFAGVAASFSAPMFDVGHLTTDVDLLNVSAAIVGSIVAV